MCRQASRNKQPKKKNEGRKEAPRYAQVDDTLALHRKAGRPHQQQLQLCHAGLLRSKGGGRNGVPSNAEYRSRVPTHLAIHLPAAQHASEAEALQKGNTAAATPRSFPHSSAHTPRSPWAKPAHRGCQ